MTNSKNGIPNRGKNQPERGKRVGPVPGGVGAVDPEAIEGNRRSALAGDILNE